MFVSCVCMLRCYIHVDYLYLYICSDSIDIDKLELPANHPFAESRQVSKEEEELQRQRLLARRGLSAQDVELLRKTQEMADDMDR